MTESGSDPGPGRPRRIMVLEDDLALRWGLEQNLRREGYEVVSAGRAPEGLALALRERPDLLILDLRLPGGSGLDVLAGLRAAGMGLPIIILSALGSEDERVRGLELGADDYVCKPFGIMELLARVKAALRRPWSAVPGAAPLRVADLEIDLAARTVRRQGRPVPLNAREFDLLLHLAQRAGRALTREQLLAGVWGYDYEGTARTVDNYIAQLRRKLEPQPRRPRRILTVRGIGYQFQGD